MAGSGDTSSNYLVRYPHFQPIPARVIEERKYNISVWIDSKYVAYYKEIIRANDHGTPCMWGCTNCSWIDLVQRAYHKINLCRPQRHFKDLREEFGYEENCPCFAGRTYFINKLKSLLGSAKGRIIKRLKDGLDKGKFGYIGTDTGQLLELAECFQGELNIRFPSFDSEKCYCSCINRAHQTMLYLTGEFRHKRQIPKTTMDIIIDYIYPWTPLPPHIGFLDTISGQYICSVADLTVCLECIESQDST